MKTYNEMNGGINLLGGASIGSLNISLGNQTITKGSKTSERLSTVIEADIQEAELVDIDDL